MKIALKSWCWRLLRHAHLLGDASNPVVASAKEIFHRQSAYLVAAAEQMWRTSTDIIQHRTSGPTGRSSSHVIQANFGACGMLSGDGPGKGPTVTETTPKDQLIPVLKQSFETCQKALDGLKDSNLGGTITYFGGAKAACACARRTDG